MKQKMYMHKLIVFGYTVTLGGSSASVYDKFQCFEMKLEVTFGHKIYYLLCKVDCNEVSNY